MIRDKDINPLELLSFDICGLSDPNRKGDALLAKVTKISQLPLEFLSDGVSFTEDTKSVYNITRLKL